MVRRALPVLVVLLAVLAIAWFLRPTYVEGETGGAVTTRASEADVPLVVLPVDEPVPARLVGHPDAVAPPAPASADRSHPERSRLKRPRFYGTVRDVRGTGLPGVRVYQTARSGSQGPAWRRQMDETDDKGWWWLEGVPPAGTWICARHPGYRSAYVEADRATSGGELHLVLEEAPTLSVQLVDAEGEPVVLGGVRAVPTTRRGAEYGFPGPGSPVSEQLEMTDATGSATFRFDVAVPVAIVPDVEGMVCVPVRQYAPAAEGTYTFRLLRAGGFEISAVDSRGQRIAESLWVSVRDVATGEKLASYRGSERDGALEAEPPLPPGRYQLDVTARGYEPALLPAFELPAGPQVVRHTLTLRPLAAQARLEILLPQPTGEPKRRAVRGSGWTLLLRRTDGPWGALGWVEHGDTRWDAEAATMTVHLRPGTWEAVASGARHDIVAVVEPVTLKTGASAERRALIVPSVSFSLYDALPPDLAVRALRVVLPGRGYFPPTGSWYSTSIRDAGGLVETIDPPGSKPRSVEGGGALLGPYPGSHVVLEVDDWSGHTHHFTVGR